MTEKSSPGPIVRWLQYWHISGQVIQIVALLFSVAATAIGTEYEIWKLDPQRLWSDWWIEWALVTGFGTLATATIFARERMEKRESEELAEARTLIEVQTSQLAAWVKISSQIRKVINRKRNTAEVLLKTTCKVQQAFADLVNNEQPKFIVHMIYNHFAHAFTGKRMRIGLFAKKADTNELTVRYSWDGNSEGCISAGQGKFKVDHAGNNKPEVVKMYHNGNHHDFLIIPDCSSHPGFIWLKPEEHDYMKSMFIFKHTFRLNDVEDAIILSIDCDLTGYFQPFTEEETRQFLIEMVSRLEYELLIRQVYDKFYPTPRAKK